MADPQALSSNSLDFRAISEDASARLVSGDHPRWDEADLVRCFIEQESTGHHDDRICTNPTDTLVCEMPLRLGRADVVIFHTNGTATVVEAKDGSRGYQYVAKGIGQVGLYAVQLGLSRANLSRIRRALLWSSTGDLFADAVIEQACEEAGVIPLPYPSMGVLSANLAAVKAALA